MHSWRNWIAHQIPILAVTGSIPVECAKGQVGRLVFLYIKFLLIYVLSWSKLKKGGGYEACQYLWKCGGGEDDRWSRACQNNRPVTLSQSYDNRASH